ncbi:hypothetical protein [Kitasatospora sp. NPDC057198]|uniref:hypothetical protein n=1 Tax=Kitasatospora sp. NPDC057198 TaxID=3346046 RepID=UPI00363D0759
MTHAGGDGDWLAPTTAFLAALDAVVWDSLETSFWEETIKGVPRALRRIVCAGPGSTEDDCDPLYGLVAYPGDPTPSAAAVALPFVLTLAADPRIGARTTLTRLLAQADPTVLSEPDRARLLALRTDPDPAVRRATLPPRADLAELLERWRTEPDPAVRVPVLFALGKAAAAPNAGPATVAALQSLLEPLLDGDDPVLRVAAVYTAAGLDRDLPVRQLDFLIRVFADPTLPPRFAELWHEPLYDFPGDRESALRGIHHRLGHDPAARLSFALRLIEASGPTGDAPLRRAALDLAWHDLLQRPSTATALLPVAGALLDDPDGPVRLRAANLLAAIGPAAAPYADRLAALLGDDADDPELAGTVGQFARWALARSGDPRALPGLVEALRAQAGEPDRGYITTDPRRPAPAHLLAPLRAHADVLLPAIRTALRDDGPRGPLTLPLLDTLESWGGAALPALPDLVPLLADTWTAQATAEVLSSLGPAAAAARPALLACPLADQPWVPRAATRLDPDRAAALRRVGAAVLAADPPGRAPFADLARFGRAAAPYADHVRTAYERVEHPWERLSAAIALWSITGEDDPAVRALEEFVLPVADGTENHGFLRDALDCLARIGTTTPAIRTALLTARASDRRLARSDGYPAILEDEDLRTLIDRVLALGADDAADAVAPGS